LNRPHVRNAVDLKTATLIASALDELDRDAELRSCVISGSGGTFCSGMDLKAFARGERPVIENRGFAGITERPPRKPIIAAVEGAAVAGGFEIVLSCDLIVASRDAQFGLPEVCRGLVAAGGGLLRLAERIPYYAAMEIALSGDPVSAEKANALGLVNRLVAPGHAEAEALRLAARITANAPLAIDATKSILVRSRDWSLDEQFARQSEVCDEVRRSADALEGANAFAQKRPPVWQGR
jgi:enoyl-CoA hydratase